MKRTRREFLENVGCGMLVAGLGAPLADDLGISSAFAGEEDTELHFGKLDSLVGLMQDTPADRLQPMLVKKLRNGDVDLRQLIAAAAFANAETFGGQDYVGFHTEMALLPALQMSAELPKERRALPVLKVLYRNAQRIQDSGLSKKKRLRKIKPVDLPDGVDEGQLLLDASRAADMDRGEGVFAASMQKSARHAFNKVLWAIQDSSNVHRFALAHRSWALIDVVGPEHAHTMLRQCIRFCVEHEPGIQKYLARTGQKISPIRVQVPKLLDEYGLLARPLGKKEADDAWLEEMSQFVYSHDNIESMEAVAAAIKAGIHPESIGQALSLAANAVVLRQDRMQKDSWRSHGATAGVHASDANNAWRNIARVSNHRNAVVGLLVSAYHTGGSKAYSDYEPLPHADDLEKIKATDATSLLAVAEEAIRQNDQQTAAAAIGAYNLQGHAERPVFDLMLKYAISEDGRLHAEKYYRTCVEEYATTSPTFRKRHLVSLARVTASAYGYTVDDKQGHRADGYEDACGLLGVDA